MLNNQTLNNPPPGDGQTPPQGDPSQQSGQTPAPATTTPSGQQSQGQGHSSLTDHWTEEDRKYIKRLRDEAEAANETAKALQAQIAAETQAKQQAEEARLKEQGEWKSLAEQHEAKVKEIEPIAARYQELASQLSSQIDKEIKDWPQSVKALDPGKDVPIEQRIAWRNNAQAIVAEIQQTARAQAPGNPPNPRSISGQNASDQNIEILRQRYQSQRGNPF